MNRLLTKNLKSLNKLPLKLQIKKFNPSIQNNFIHSKNSFFTAKKQQSSHNHNNTKTYKKTDTKTYKQTDKNIDSKINKQTDKEMGKKVDTKTTKKETIKTENLVQKLEEKEKKINGLKDQTLRLVAELDNTRKIAQKEIKKSEVYSVSKFALSLLTAHDNLQRALDVAVKSIDKAKTKEKQSEIDKAFIGLFEGIKLTEDALDKTFSDFGIKKIDCKCKFDPKYHDVLTTVKDETKEDMTISNVLTEGFTIHDRTLRAAQVVAVKN